MRFKIKKKGLLFDKRESLDLAVREISVRKSALRSEDVVQVFVRGKKSSGILEIKRSELKTILERS